MSNEDDLKPVTPDDQHKTTEIAETAPSEVLTPKDGDLVVNTVLDQTKGAMRDSLPEDTSRIKRFSYTSSDFPEQPDWGLTRGNLTGAHITEYRKDGRRINSARVIESLKETGLPIDRILAVAAAVSEIEQPKAKYVHFLRELEINLDNGQVKCRYDRNPSTGKEEDFEKIFTGEEIATYHIPTQTGHNDPSAYAEAMAKNPHETLSTMVSGGENKSGLSIDGWYVNTGFMPAYSRMATIVKGGTPFVMFPIDKLDLSETEEKALNITKRLAGDTIRIEQLATQLSRIAAAVKEKDKGKNQLLLFMKGLREKLLHEEVMPVLQELIAFSYRPRKIEEKSARLILEERSNGRRLASIPDEIIRETEKLDAEAKKMIAEAEKIIERARAEKYPVPELGTK